MAEDRRVNRDPDLVAAFRAKHAGHRIREEEREIDGVKVVGQMCSDCSDRLESRLTPPAE